MSMLRWAPFRELEDLRAQLNELISGQKQLPTLSGRETMTVADWVPAVDISETELEFLIKAEIPEIKKEDVKVTVQDGVLKLHLPKTAKAQPRAVEVEIK